MHSSVGIFLLEKIFGPTITNSDGKEVHVRDIGEQHVIDDLGFIPSLDDWVRDLPLLPWMCGAAKGHPELRPNGKRATAKTIPRKRTPVSSREELID